MDEWKKYCLCYISTVHQYIASCYSGIQLGCKFCQLQGTNEKINGWMDGWMDEWKKYCLCYISTVRQYITSCYSEIQLGCKFCQLQMKEKINGWMDGWMKEILSVLHFNCTSIHSELGYKSCQLHGTNERINGWMDGWMNERNIVCVTSVVHQYIASYFSVLSATWIKWKNMWMDGWMDG